MKHLLDTALNIAFGCWHKNYSFPQKPKDVRHNAAAALTGTYVVCLDCGKDLPYDWERMKVVSAPRQARKAAAIPQAAINA